MSLVYFGIFLRSRDCVNQSYDGIWGRLGILIKEYALSNQPKPFGSYFFGVGAGLMAVYLGSCRLGHKEGGNGLMRIASGLKSSTSYSPRMNPERATETLVLIYCLCNHSSPFPEFSDAM
jgi:hypothetical protein